MTIEKLREHREMQLHEKKKNGRPLEGKTTSKLDEMVAQSLDEIITPVEIKL